MLTVSSVYVLRWRRPDLPRPFRTPGYPVIPAVYLVGTGLLTAAVFYERPIVTCASLLSILAGVPVYFAWSALAGSKIRDRIHIKTIYKNRYSSPPSSSSASSTEPVGRRRGQAEPRGDRRGRRLEQVAAEPEQGEVLGLGLQHHVEVQVAGQPQEGDELERVDEVGVPGPDRRQERRSPSCRSCGPSA